MYILQVPLDQDQVLLEHLLEHQYHLLDHPHLREQYLEDLLVDCLVEHHHHHHHQVHPTVHHTIRQDTLGRSSLICDIIGI